MLQKTVPLLRKLIKNGKMTETMMVTRKQKDWARKWKHEEEETLPE